MDDARRPPAALTNPARSHDGVCTPTPGAEVSADVAAWVRPTAAVTGHAPNPLPAPVTTAICTESITLWMKG